MPARRSLTALVATAAVLGAGVASADAARPPTAGERAAVRAAVAPMVPPQWRDDARILVRVSTADRRFPLARVMPRRGREHIVQSTGVTLRRGVRAWRVLDAGTTALGCALPRRVAAISSGPSPGTAAEAGRAAPADWPPAPHG